MSRRILREAIVIWVETALVLLLAAMCGVPEVHERSTLAESSLLVGKSVSIQETVQAAMWQDRFALLFRQASR